MGLYLFIVLFFCLYILILEGNYNKAFSKLEKNYIVKIVSMKESGSYTDKYIAKVLYGKDKNFRVYLYTSKDSNYCYGDIVKVNGEVQLPSKARNDKGFDYCRYLRTKKIVASIFVEKIEYIKRQENFLSKIYDVKLKCSDIINNNFPKEEAEILKALLLGNKSDISDETEEVFSKSNLSHILAISGLHVTYIVFFLEKFLDKILNNIKLKNLVLILFLIVFMIFVGNSPSAMRACIMTIMLYLGKIFLREKDFYTSFILSLVLILLINPYNIYSISMWLSFLGTLGIVLFSNFFQIIFLKKLKVKSKIIKQIIESICVSFSAQLLIFPIMWKNFGTISINFWISNLLVSELIAPILVIRVHECNFISNKNNTYLHRTFYSKTVYKFNHIFFENPFKSNFYTYAE